MVIIGYNNNVGKKEFEGQALTQELNLTYEGKTWWTIWTPLRNLLYV